MIASTPGSAATVSIVRRKSALVAAASMSTGFVNAAAGGRCSRSARRVSSCSGSTRRPAAAHGVDAGDRRARRRW